MVKFDEKKWQAEQDAETLARYQEIMDSPTRKNAAIKAARQKADALDKRSTLMKKALGGNLKKK
jgi:hypothetical protein